MINERSHDNLPNHLVRAALRADGLQTCPANRQPTCEDGSPDPSDRVVTNTDGSGEPSSQISA
jgi:hypothetical protein